MVKKYSINSNFSITFGLYWIIIFFVMNCGILKGQDAKPAIYLIPGQGADSRQFKNLSIDNKFDVRYIEYFTPEKGWKMNDFAKALATQIDTTRNFVILGVSLGGMIATEMGDFLHPEKIILISSAKCKDELPVRYKFQRAIPLYKLFPAIVLKGGAKLLQPIVEPDRKYDSNTFKLMLDEKDPLFLKRTIAMILNWDRTSYSNDIVHIHGDNDHTIPVKNIRYDFLIEDGSHMMVFTRADEIGNLINNLLSEMN